MHPLTLSADLLLMKYMYIYFYTFVWKFKKKKSNHAVFSCLNVGEKNIKTTRLLIWYCWLNSWTSSHSVYVFYVCLIHAFIEVKTFAKLFENPPINNQVIALSRVSYVRKRPITLNIIMVELWFIYATGRPITVNISVKLFENSQIHYQVFFRQEISSKNKITSTL